MLPFLHTLISTKGETKAVDGDKSQKRFEDIEYNNILMGIEINANKEELSLNRY